MKPMPHVIRSGREVQSRPAPAGRKAAAEGTANSDLAREINRDVVLELVREHQPVSRVELARFSGMQNSTVSSIVEQLLSEGWISEGEALKTARGRPPTQISLNAELLILVADVHCGRAFVAVVDLNGRILESGEAALAETPEQGSKDLLTALQRMRALFAERIFKGVGVCLPGRIDRATGRVILAPNLHWENTDLQLFLREGLGLRVELENDANASLLAELWFGRREGLRDVVLLAISEGIGASLLADGNLISGRLGLAGELGHVCLHPRGPVCGCGRRGCWEVFASSRAALGYYRDLVPAAPLAGYRELLALAEAGDRNANEALDLQADALGRGLRIVTAALDPQAILFAGEISLGWERILPKLEKACRSGMLAGTPPRLLCTGAAGQTQLRGAAAVVLQRHGSYYRSRSRDRASNANGVRSGAFPEPTLS